MNTSGSPVGTYFSRPSSPSCGLTHSKITPFSFPFSWINSFGGRLLMMGMPSLIASSFSHSLAFITSKPDRTTTLTVSAPRRLDVRQQSIAVFPPPITMTLPSILEVWPNATLDNQSIPMDIWSLTSSLPGMFRSRPLGAPVPTK